MATSSTNPTSLKSSSRTVHVRGVDFHVETCNPDAPNQVICLAGALGTARSHFGPQLEKGLGENFCLVAVDPRGLGASQSAGPRDFPLDYYERDAADAAAIMKELGHGRYALLGWSDGANAALKLASHHSSVSKLVVWGGNAYFTADEVSDLEQKLDSSKWSPDMMDFFLPAVGGVEQLQRHNELLVNAIKRCYTEHGGVLLTDEELSSISCPTLVLHGAKDDLCDTKHAKYIAEHIPNASLAVFQEAGHDLHLTLTDEFEKVVRAFLNKE